MFQSMLECLRELTVGMCFVICDHAHVYTLQAQGEPAGRLKVAFYHSLPTHSH